MYYYLIVLFILSIIWLSAYHNRGIRYSFITFLVLILIYPRVTDPIFVSTWRVQVHMYDFLNYIGTTLRSYVHEKKKTQH